MLCHPHPIYFAWNFHKLELIMMKFEFEFWARAKFSSTLFLLWLFVSTLPFCLVSPFIFKQERGKSWKTGVPFLLHGIKCQIQSEGSQAQDKIIIIPQFPHCLQKQNCISAPLPFFTLLIQSHSELKVVSTQPFTYVEPGDRSGLLSLPLSLFLLFSHISQTWNWHLVIDWLDLTC